MRIMHSGNMCNLYCSGCGEFLSSSSKAAGRGARCRKCDNKRKREERKRLQVRKQLVLIDRLGGICVHCNKEAIEDNMVCFDFHHIDKELKEDGIANMLAANRPIEIIEKEVDKCVLLCACCHRLHHHKYGY